MAHDAPTLERDGPFDEALRPKQTSLRLRVTKYVMALCNTVMFCSDLSIREFRIRLFALVMRSVAACQVQCVPGAMLAL